MTSTVKPADNAPAPIAALALKVVGGITILAGLVDFIILPIPFNLAERQWQIAVTRALVERGIVPLVGIALLFAGFWIESYVGAAKRRFNLLLDSRFWTCVLSSVFGLLFIVLAFIHPNNVQQQSREALSRLAEEATQAETQLGQTLSQRLAQQRGQIDALLQDEDLLNQALSSGQVSEEQAAQIQEFKNNPESLDTFLQEQVTQAQTEAQTEIGTRREQATKTVRRDALKDSVRISVSSILLAIGYTFIGWTGLRRLLSINR
ncbi:MAG: HpsJ family protein [Cyanobacteria bacterium J06626_23]